MWLVTALLGRIDQKSKFGDLLPLLDLVVLSSRSQLLKHSLWP